MKSQSYITNCFIKTRENEPADFLFAVDTDHDVTVKLDRYAVVPIEEWDTLLSANREMRERLESAAKYLCRLEGAMLADDLDMKLNFPGEMSPTAMAESILPGFDSIEYDLARSALTTQSGDGE